MKLRKQYKELLQSIKLIINYLLNFFKGKLEKLMKKEKEKETTEYWKEEIKNCRYRIAMFPQDRDTERKYLHYAQDELEKCQLKNIKNL